MVSLSLLLDNLLTPPVLFFCLGFAAVLVRSDLEIPQPLPKLFSLYLLLAIGFKGGVELRHSGLNREVAAGLGAGLLIACAVPLYAFAILRTRIDRANAAALAATYGSISAVTFIAATTFLDRMEIPYGGHMVAAMALMESPAIVIGVLLHRRGSGERGGHWKELMREALFNGSVFLLVGSLAVGFLADDAGAQSVRPLLVDLFKGVLCFFLLDMGIVAARRIGDLVRAGAFLAVFAVAVPLLNAALAIPLARAIGLGAGDALLLAVLAAGASYIAVPAAMRLSIPEANPSYYVPMALAITFPFNVILGIPLYMAVIEAFWK